VLTPKTAGGPVALSLLSLSSLSLSLKETGEEREKLERPFTWLYYYY